MIHPLCGFSLEKGTRFIAVFDLVLYILCSLITLIVDYSTDVPEDDSLPKPLAADPVNSYKHETEEEPNFRFFGHSISMFVYMSLVVFILIMVVGEFLLEIWMFFVLSRASKNRDAAACRLWLGLRAALFVLYFTLTFLKYATVGWDWSDWILPPYAFYSIWEFIIVNEFRKETKATCRIVKLRDETVYEF